MSCRYGQNIRTDSESIELAVETKLAGEKIPTNEDGRMDYRALQRIIRRYNGNERFVELVESTYFVLVGDDAS